MEVEGQGEERSMELASKFPSLDGKKIEKVIRKLDPRKGRTSTSFPFPLASTLARESSGSRKVTGMPWIRKSFPERNGIASPLK